MPTAIPGWRLYWCQTNIINYMYCCMQLLGFDDSGCVGFHAGILALLYDKNEMFSNGKHRSSLDAANLAEVGEQVVVHGVGHVVNQVLEGALAGDDCLGAIAQHGQHSLRSTAAHLADSLSIGVKRCEAAWGGWQAVGGARWVLAPLAAENVAHGQLEGAVAWPGHLVVRMWPKG
ncbi:hypothetical protein HaLaN_12541 [Haematococcus lacustris]|uniref:Uncharacterized protein n=1 Tax=Haematococcus lacustris TaxID=44745 RepID=A0A699Z3N3_HAELA|nr:hypothetical protein HaLaN_12541 [Haematococcus lacustris]